MAAEVHRRVRRPAKLHRHLDDLEPELTSDDEYLHVESEAIDLRPLKDRLRRVCGEGLDAGLGVRDAVELQHVGEGAESGAGDTPTERRPDQYGAAVVPSAANSYVGTLLDRLEKTDQIVGSIGQIRVDECDRPPGRNGYSGPNRSAFAQVRELKHRVGACRFGRMGGAVAGPIISDDDLERRIDGKEFLA